MLGVCYIEVTGEFGNVFIHLFFSLFKCLEEATPAKLRGHSWQTGGGVGRTLWHGKDQTGSATCKANTLLVVLLLGDFSCVILGYE